MSTALATSAEPSNLTGMSTGDAVLAGHRVAITGALTGPLQGLRRRTALSMVADLGGQPARSVSGRTTILVASRQDTTKCRRAQALGIRIVSPGEFAAMLGYPSLW